MSRRPVSRKPTAGQPWRSPGFASRFIKNLTRDLAMFAVGLGLVIYEAVLREGDPREVLIILYAAMMGLPLVFQGDEFRRRRNGSSADDRDEDV